MLCLFYLLWLDLFVYYFLCLAFAKKTKSEGKKLDFHFSIFIWNTAKKQRILQKKIRWPYILFAILSSIFSTNFLQWREKSYTILFIRASDNLYLVTIRYKPFGCENNGEKTKRRKKVIQWISSNQNILILHFICWIYVRIAWKKYTEFWPSEFKTFCIET